MHNDFCTTIGAFPPWFQGYLEMMVLRHPILMPQLSEMRRRAWYPTTKQLLPCKLEFHITNDVEFAWEQACVSHGGPKEFDEYTCDLVMKMHKDMGIARVYAQSGLDVLWSTVADDTPPVAPAEGLWRGACCASRAARPPSAVATRACCITDKHAQKLEEIDVFCEEVGEYIERKCKGENMRTFLRRTALTMRTKANWPLLLTLDPARAAAAANPPLLSIVFHINDDSSW